MLPLVVWRCSDVILFSLFQILGKVGKAAYSMHLPLCAPMATPLPAMNPIASYVVHDQLAMWLNKSLVMLCWKFHTSGAVFRPTLTEGPVGTR
jgi:hypothetical protein